MLGSGTNTINHRPYNSEETIHLVGSDAAVAASGVGGGRQAANKNFLFGSVSKATAALSVSSVAS